VRVLIVDDEPLARQRLVAQLGELGFGADIDEAENGLAALARLDVTTPDVVLVDVRMPAMDGLETARHLARLERPPAIIFTTAYDDHALAAFESQALAYLLKPVRSEKLAEALERARLLHAGREAVATPQIEELGSRTYVSAVVGGNLRLLAVREVCYFQADQGYVSAVSATTNLLLEESLRVLEEEFGGLFVRIHRNALVNTAHVDSLRKDVGGNTAVVFKNLDETLIVSRRLLAGVRKRLRKA
jgi:two-component system response regulator AlgR